MDIVSVFNFQLGQTPPIIEAVFQNLPCRDLHRCAQVSRLWENVAHNVIERRLPEIAHCLLNYYEDGENWHQALRAKLLTLNYEPHVVLVFAMNPESHWLKDKLTANVESGSRLNWEMIRSGNARLRRHLPPTCTQLFCCPSGISPPPMQRIFSGCEETAELAAIFFPVIPGFQVHVTEITKFCLDSTLKESHIPDDSKLTIILYNQSGPPDVYMRGLEHALVNFINRRDQKFAVGGVLVSQVDILGSNHDFSRFGTCALSFTGDNVLAASVVIPPNLQTADYIERKLRGLLNTQLFEGQCIAFAFTCVVRSLCYMRAKGVEYDVFKRLFPTVPLFICIGERAVGIDYLPNMAESIPVNSVFQKNSTVFVVLSLRK